MQYMFYKWTDAPKKARNSLKMEIKPNCLYTTAAANYQTLVKRGGKKSKNYLKRGEK